MHEPEPEPEVEATVALGEAEEQRQIWVREFSVELHDWKRAHERGERLLQRFATAAAAVLESAEPGQQEDTGMASLISGLVPATVDASSKADRVAGNWQSVGECLKELAAVGKSLEDSAAGMATAIQETRRLTAVGTESKHLRQLAELETKYQMREAETQLKLVIVESLEGLLHSQLSGQPPAAAEGSGMRLQVLMTKYRAAWSTLPYCDDHIEAATSADEQRQPQAELAAEDNSDSGMH